MAPLTTNFFNGGINEARLGMAMKECFKVWLRCGLDIHREKIKAFIRETIETYYLFSKIADMVKQGQQYTEEEIRNAMWVDSDRDELI